MSLGDGLGFFSKHVCVLSVGLPDGERLRQTGASGADHAGGGRRRGQHLQETQRGRRKIWQRHRASVLFWFGPQCLFVVKMFYSFPDFPHLSLSFLLFFLNDPVLFKETRMPDDTPYSVPPHHTTWVVVDQSHVTVNRWLLWLVANKNVVIIFCIYKLYKTVLFDWTDFHTCWVISSWCCKGDDGLNVCFVFFFYCLWLKRRHVFFVSGKF